MLFVVIVVGGGGVVVALLSCLSVYVADAIIGIVVDLVVVSRVRRLFMVVVLFSWLIEGAIKALSFVYRKSLDHTE